MKRPKHAGTAEHCDHTLNWANLRVAILEKDVDYEAFEKILSSREDVVTISRVHMRSELFGNSGPRSLT
jgi:hypothetical protein